MLNKHILHKSLCFAKSKLSFFSLRESHGHHKHSKSYRRILPSAKNLILKHEIKDIELPDIQIIKKEHILELLKNRREVKADTPSAVSKKEAIVLQNQNIFDEISSDKQIDYLSFKNKLPHSYYYNTAKIENLNKYLKELNTNHKKDIKVDDFIAKVKYFNQ
jgi:hypothetical protein